MLSGPRRKIQIPLFSWSKDSSFPTEYKLEFIAESGQENKIGKSNWRNKSINCEKMAHRRCLESFSVVELHEERISASRKLFKFDFFTELTLLIHSRTLTIIKTTLAHIKVQFKLNDLILTFLLQPMSWQFYRRARTMTIAISQIWNFFDKFSLSSSSST